ncbi:MAG: hypothetical protein ACRDUV_20700 [Pseudonocardiaceae bacterium]
MAPDEVRHQTQLAVDDFLNATGRPLTALRSDAVAHRFTVTPARSGLNVLVARMTVPGGPWPGHFGLEAAVFRSSPAVMPTAFPPARSELALHFGTLLATSRGYRNGSGAVLFPEQLSVATRPVCQTFGVVFLNRLHELFLARVLPVLEEDTFTLAERENLLELRRQAFLAHERGHLQGADLEMAVLTRRHRLTAVVSELHADLDALVMLLDHSDPMAPATARVLVADRIVREAWLRRPYAQVDAIAARQLLVLLTRAAAVALSEDGGVRLEIDRARDRLSEELDRVRELERVCCRVGLEPAQEYLRASGWVVVDSACHRELEAPLARFLGYAASRSVPVA